VRAVIERHAANADHSKYVGLSLLSDSARISLKY